MEHTNVRQVRAQSEAALRRGDFEAAWAALIAIERELTRDPEVAALWVELLRATPTRAHLHGEVSRILARWPDDPVLVTRACDALIRRAESIPPDEPSAERDALARLAASAADGCLQTMADERQPALRAFLQMGRGNALRLAGDHAEALESLLAALQAEPDRGAWWFNLGLLHKAQGAWQEALQANRRARSLLGDDKAVLWNLAICATASGEGTTAVEAFQRLGHRAELAPSGMPYVPGLPPASVRVATLGSGLGASSVPDRSVGFERLWVTPASPCHGVVSSPSYRDASTDYGDLVLWDGQPVGMSAHEGRPAPCFPLLAVLRKGDEHRLRFVALQQAAGQVAALAEQLPDEARLFIHHERIEKLCARCASGEHLFKHRHSPAEEHRLVYGKLILRGSTDLGLFRRELDQRLRSQPGVQLVMPRLLELVGDTVAAGNAHRLWRALAQRSA